MKRTTLIIGILFLLIAGCDNFSIGTGLGGSGDRIIDHEDIVLTDLSERDIQKAADSLHIGYGHTSHGSQLTSGMSGLPGFIEDGGLEGVFSADTFTWSRDGSVGLHLYEGDGYGDGDLDHDCGYDGWTDETREFLNSNPGFNVIMWSWCGQVGSFYASGELDTHYLDAMNRLEQDYPNVTFVYMTGHADGSGLDGDVHLANMQIREYCEDNNKWLYDFYDIECHDPDGNYYGNLDVRDSCDYDGGNWAQEWQDANPGKWYDCGSAHSEPLNANMKAYAAWALFAAIASE